MIVVQIHSGLGNQLFMYAAARALAYKRNTREFNRSLQHGIEFTRRRLKSQGLSRTLIQP
jgi:hypothetical protein